MTNKQRGAKGRAALRFFALTGRGGVYSPKQEDLIDLLADLQHFAAQHKALDWEGAVRNAKNHFEEETYVEN